MNTQHTPTPWQVIYFENNSREKATIISGDIPVVSVHCGFVKDPLANAEFIVRAVNAHERLVAFAKLVSDFTANDSSGHMQYLKQQADNALQEVAL